MRAESGLHSLFNTVYRQSGHNKYYVYADFNDLLSSVLIEGYPLQITDLPRVEASYMGSGVGYGLRTLDPIQKGKVVGFYTGKLVTNETVTKEDERYCMPCASSTGFGIVACYSIDKANGHTAAEITSPAGLMQHAPSDLRIGDWTDHYVLFNNDKQQKIMLANVRYLASTNIDVTMEDGAIFNLAVPVFIASDDIKEGEFLYHDYGKKYWAEYSETPKLFSTDGDVISCMEVSKFRGQLYQYNNQGRTFHTQEKYANAVDQFQAGTQLFSKFSLDTIVDNEVKELLFSYGATLMYNFGSTVLLLKNPNEGLLGLALEMLNACRLIKSKHLRSNCCKRVDEKIDSLNKLCRSHTFFKECDEPPKCPEGFPGSPSIM